jgi:hypothetical protein
MDDTLHGLAAAPSIMVESTSFSVALLYKDLS